MRNWRQWNGTWVRKGKKSLVANASSNRFLSLLCAFVDGDLKHALMSSADGMIIHQSASIEEEARVVLIAPYIQCISIGQTTQGGVFERQLPSLANQLNKDINLTSKCGHLHDSVAIMIDRKTYHGNGMEKYVCFKYCRYHHIYKQGRQHFPVCF